MAVGCEAYRKSIWYIVPCTIAQTDTAVNFYDIDSKYYENAGDYY